MNSKTLLLLLLPLLVICAALPCRVHEAAKGTVCKCTADYCDSVDPVGDLAPGQAMVYSTRQDNNDRLTRDAAPLTFEQSVPAQPFKIKVDRTKQMQTIKGFGGAFTDAAAINFYKMTSGVQTQILKQYFGSDSIKYTIGRIPIASCDFSTYHYSYDDYPNDMELKNFSIAMDFQYKLPFIREALSLAANSHNISLYGCPWSPPIWMKDNNAINRGFLRGTAGDPLHKTLANYYVKFVTAYKEAGVPIWGISVLNEPTHMDGITWESMEFPAQDERDFVREDLGPAMRSVHPEVKILVGDDQRTNIREYAGTILSDPGAAQYVSGVGFHWYTDVDNFFPHWDEISKLRELYPDQLYFQSEACTGSMPWSRGVWLGDFGRGLLYASDIAHLVNNGAGAWNDWNLLLDMNGGPNWAGNYVDAPIILDTEKGTVFYKNPMYYAMGHYSAFVPPGSVHVGIESTSSVPLIPGLEATAFVTPSGQVVVVVINSDAISGRDFVIEDTQLGSLRTHVPKMTIRTYVYQP